MKKPIEMRAFYKRVLSIFELPPLSQDILTRIMAGSEKANDYEEVLKYDKFFTEMICKFASAHMKTSVVTSLGHGVVVVGQQSVRNMVLGHQISRIFSPHADTAFKDLETSGKLVKYGLRAEEFAKKCGNEYTGLAFTAGYIFDIFNGWFESDKKMEEKFSPLLDQVWKHGLRAASLAWALANHERVFISLRKNVFAAALLHDIGKLGLALLAPEDYALAFEKIKTDREINPSDDSYEAKIEKDYFDLTHQEVGSAIIFQSKLLRDLENFLDYHHDSILLKARHADSFLVAAIINIADRLSVMTEKKATFTMEELQEVVRPHKDYFPLKAHDVMDLYAILRGKALLAA